MSTTNLAGPIRAQKFKAADEAANLAGLSSHSNMAGDERINIAGPKHMLPDMAHDNSSK